jgi:hypothetical protein
MNEKEWKIYYILITLKYVSEISKKNEANFTNSEFSINIRDFLSVLNLINHRINEFRKYALFRFENTNDKHMKKKIT